MSEFLVGLALAFPVVVTAFLVILHRREERRCALRAQRFDEADW